jgi:hypothetical protein
MPAHRLPNFVMIGASKCSTTTMYRLLQRHPGVSLPRDKGAYSFNDRKFSAPGALERYRSLFAGVPQSVPIIGESSNTYTHQPSGGPIAQRMKELLGPVKLLYMVRDPVARGVSHYRHKCLDETYRRPFDQALAMDPLLATVGRYHYQLEPYVQIFGREAIHIVVAEHLQHDPIGVMRGVEQFLGLEPRAWTPDDLPTSNKFSELQHTAHWQRLLGDKLFRRLRHLTPQFLRRRVKRLAPKLKDPPPVTAEHEQMLLEAIADDLRLFRQVMGSAIDLWPSVQKLEPSDRPAPGTVHA